MSLAVATLWLISAVVAHDSSSTRGGKGGSGGRQDSPKFEDLVPPIADESSEVTSYNLLVEVARLKFLDKGAGKNCKVTAANGKSIIKEGCNH